jgi:hypothetical protein
LKRANAIIDSKVEEVEKYKDCARMFKATKQLISQTKASITVHDHNGRTLTNNLSKIRRMSEWFQSQLNQPTAQALTSEDIPKGPLSYPITDHEVKDALQRLNNNRASGPDEVAGELWKYCTDIVCAPLADIFNQALEEGQPLDLGEGILIPLQKPNKQKGPLTSIRPIVLLSTIRKALSLIVLSRISERVNTYLAPSQSGFMSGRSTADIVWCDRWLAAMTQRFKWSCELLGIDMSRAFDTINRLKLIQVMDTIIDADEGRMIRLLLANTILSIRINDTTGTPFTTTTGTPQGDSLSPVLFVCYLEAALRDGRAHLEPVPQADMIFPTETEYADDITFISTSHDHLQQALPQIKTILETWDLHVNEAKTEWVELTSSNPSNEAWRNVKALGSLLGDQQDVQRRKRQGSITFCKMMTLWFRRHHVSEPRRIRLYKACVLPTLTYNIGTWGLTKSEFNSLDTFHRKQLRFLLGIFHPDHISNKAL